ncbi:hypothetical protein J6590_030233, partial [Homalodisca vitripennis]
MQKEWQRPAREERSGGDRARGRDMSQSLLQKRKCGAAQPDTRVSDRGLSTAAQTLLSSTRTHPYSLDEITWASGTLEVPSIYSLDKLSQRLSLQRKDHWYVPGSTKHTHLDEITWASGTLEVPSSYSISKLSQRLSLQ